MSSPVARSARLLCLLAKVLVVASLLARIPAAHAQITLGQADTFEGGTVADWVHGSLTPGDPSVVAGGPLGPNDYYLQVVSTGSGDGGTMTTYNATQWTGDYTGAGVTRVEMDLKGFSSPGSADLSIRLALRLQTGFSSAGYVSTTAFMLPIDGQWHHASFDLSAMTPVGSPATSLSTLLSNLPELRILDAAAANTVHGDSIVAQIGIDNVTAVPEPISTLVAALALTGFAVRRRF